MAKIAFDAAPNSQELYNDATSTSTVTYTDIQGGSTGTGNINANLIVHGNLGTLSVKQSILAGNTVINAASTIQVAASGT